MMDLHSLNIELFQRLSLALAIIRRTPSGMKVDVFVRCLARRVLISSNLSESIIDQYLLLRQQDLLQRLSPVCSSLTTTVSFMDLSSLTAEDDSIRCHNEYEYGDFADKLCQLKTAEQSIRVCDIEFLLNTLNKWISRLIEVNQKLLPMDACLYAVQLINHYFQIDTDKPFHLFLNLLPLIDKFLDSLLNSMEQAQDEQAGDLHTMLISFASTNLCISRVLDKLAMRLRYHCERIDESDRPFIVDRFFKVLHVVVHHRFHFQRSLSARSVEKLTVLIQQLLPLLDGKSTYHHLLRLQAQFQIDHRYRQELSKTSLHSYPSSSSSEHSQCQTQKYKTNKDTLSIVNRLPSFDYSLSQHSQSLYF